MITRRGMCAPRVVGRSSRSGESTRGFCGHAAGVRAPRRGGAACRSRTSTPRRCRPCRRARSRSAGSGRRARCRSKPSSVRFCQGNSPCQVLAIILPARRELVAPGVDGAFEPAARGELPFGFGRQLLAGPGRVGLRRPPRRRGRPGAARGRRRVLSGPSGWRQLRAGHVGPPVAIVAKIDRPGASAGTRAIPARAMRGRRRGSRGVERALGHRDVAGRLHEAPELRDGDRVLVNPEPIDAHAVDRAAPRDRSRRSPSGTRPAAPRSCSSSGRSPVAAVRLRFLASGRPISSTPPVRPALLSTTREHRRAAPEKDGPDVCGNIRPVAKRAHSYAGTVRTHSRA